MNRVKRFHYSATATNALFEQSLDVYYPKQQQQTIPPPIKQKSNNDDNDNDRLTKLQLSPVVLLVVGSGWMGHQPFIYRMTSWWNSSGPRSVANSFDNTTCVCIRHRSGFIHPRFINEFIIVMGIAQTIMSSYHNERGDLFVLMRIMGLMLWFLLQWLARGVANFDDMMDDVEEAISFVMDNQERLGIAIDADGNDKQQQHQRRPFIFGGYSSGGHVAAMMLQRNPEKWQACFDGILYISGVFAVRPPTPTKESSPGAFLHNKPRFLTDLVMHIVWGEESRHSIPSPIESNSITNTIKLPHLLIACRNEVFGLSILDVFLCSQVYYEKLLQLGTIPSVTLRHVQSDHWFILSCRELQNVLREEIPKLLRSSSERIIQPATSNKSNRRNKRNKNEGKKAI
mmetsp:Transcript_21874/g.28311  ORF Transcript_21874/g.28311 Transcript_21874/m.28311 type:complete len:399 (+) Transcript_21874:106-1302(+)